MFSKSLLKGLSLLKCIRVILVGSLLIIQVGCNWSLFRSLKWGEDNPPSQNARLNLDQYNCLKNIDEKVNLYLKSKMQPAEVSRIGTCLQTALEKFRDKIHDPYLPKGEYSPLRLAEFLNKEYLSKENPITFDFIQELMKLKALVLGGNVKVITSREIDGAIKVLDVLKKEALDLLPFMQTYSLLNKMDSDKVSRQEIWGARQQLHKTAKSFAEILSASGNNYSLDSLGRLLEQLQLFLNWDVFHGTSYSYDKLYELIHLLKELAVGNGDDLISPDEWGSMLHTVSASYGFYINYELKLKNQNLQFGPSFEVFLDTMNESMDLVTEWIKKSPDKVISFSVTDKLFKALESQGLSPGGLPSEGIIRAYRKFVSRGLRVVGATESENNKGLGLPQLEQLRSEFKIWADSQSLLNSGIETSLKIKFSNYESVSEEDYNRIELLDLSKLFSSKQISLNSLQFNLGVIELANILTSTRPFFKINDNRAYLMPAKELPEFGVFNNIQNLSYMNLMKTLVRALIRSFADDQRFLSMEGVTLPEMEDFHSTVKQVAVHLRLMDPRKQSGGKNYFNEANLFTFSGSGIEAEKKGSKKVDIKGKSLGHGEIETSKGMGIASYQEVLELLAILWSSSNIRHKLYDEKLNLCRSLNIADGPNDVFDLPKINRACFLDHFFDQDLVEFENLPRLREAMRTLNPEDRVGFSKLTDKQKKYVKELDPKNRSRLLESLQTIAEIQCENPKYIENAEIATMATVLHYTEVIFTVYDKNGDGVLDGYESMSAFQRFHGYLAEAVEKVMSPNVTSDRLRKLYWYLNSDQPLPSWYESFLASIDSLSDSKPTIRRLRAIYSFLVGGQNLPNWYESIMIIFYEYGYFFFEEDPSVMPTKFPTVSMDREDFIRLLATLARANRGDPVSINCNSR